MHIRAGSRRSSPASLPGFTGLLSLLSESRYVGEMMFISSTTIYFSQNFRYLTINHQPSMLPLALECLPFNIIVHVHVQLYPLFKLEMEYPVTTSVFIGRRSGLMVSTLNSGVSAPGSSPGRGHCFVFLGKTLNSHGASLHPGV